MAATRFQRPPHDEPDYTIPEAQVLYVCRGRDAERFLDEHPRSPFVIVLDEPDIPEWADRHPDRLLIIQKDRAYSFILFMVQEFFLNMVFWIRRMDEIVKKLQIPTSLQEFGVPKEDLDGLVEAGMQVKRLLVNNMREITPEDARAIYLQVM